MSDSSSGLIVHFDGVIDQILKAAPGQAVELLMREYRLSSSRDEFVAALVAKLALKHLKHQAPMNGGEA